MTTLTPDPSRPDTNPFNKLLLDCNNDSTKIQTIYETHRTNRNAQFKERLLDKEFPDWRYDEILSKLIEAKEAVRAGKAERESDVFADHRNNLNVYARPPEHIKELVARTQLMILNDARSLWISPPESLHVTTLEIASSRTKEDIDALASRLVEDGTAEKLVNYIPDKKRCVRLINPIVSFDDSAIALSFLPVASGTEDSIPTPTPSADRGLTPAHADEGTDAQHEDNDDSNYTYHHLRRDLASTVLKSGVALAARYIVPSAHITIARFVEPDNFWWRDGELDRERVAKFVHCIGVINEGLRKNHWVDSPINKGNESKSETAKNGWVNVPKTRKTYCKGKECHKHTQHKVTQYKAGKASLFAQGKRRYDRKQSGYGGQTKPVFHKKAKTTKKVVLRLECTQCKTKKQLALKRCKHFELGGDKKTKGAALVF
ncbi:60S ribosomal protein L44 [Aspergillus venezuelensis]